MKNNPSLKQATQKTEDFNIWSKNMQKEIQELLTELKEVIKNMKTRYPPKNDKLPIWKRIKIMELRFMKDYAYRAIHKELGISISTVKKYLEQQYIDEILALNLPLSAEFLKGVKTTCDI